MRTKSTAEDWSHVYPASGGTRFTPPWGGFAGGIKERIGGNLKRIASRSQTAGIRPHFACLRRGFTIDACGWWSSLWDRSERSIMVLYPPAQRDRRFPGISVFSNSREVFWLPPYPLFNASSEPPKGGEAGPVCYGVNVRTRSLKSFVTG